MKWRINAFRFFQMHSVYSQCNTGVIGASYPSYQPPIIIKKDNDKDLMTLLLLMLLGNGGFC